MKKAFWTISAALGLLLGGFFVAQGVNCPTSYPVSLSNWTTGCVIPSSWANALETTIGTTTAASSLEARVAALASSTGGASTTLVFAGNGILVSQVGSNATVTNAGVLSFNGATGTILFSAPATSTITASGTTLTGPAFTFASTTTILPFASGSQMYFALVNTGNWAGTLQSKNASDFLASSTVYVSTVNGSSGALTITSSSLGVVVPTVNLAGSSTAGYIPYWLDTNGDLSSSSLLSQSSSNLAVNGADSLGNLNSSGTVLFESNDYLNATNTAPFGTASTSIQISTTTGLAASGLVEINNVEDAYYSSFTSAGTSSTLNGMIRGLFATALQSRTGTSTVSFGAIPFLMAQSSSTPPSLIEGCAFPTNIGTFCGWGVWAQPSNSAALNVSGKIILNGGNAIQAGANFHVFVNNGGTQGFDQQSNGDFTIGSTTDLGAFAVAPSSTPYFVISSSTGSATFNAADNLLNLNASGSVMFESNDYLNATTTLAFGTGSTTIQISTTTGLAPSGFVDINSGEIASYSSFTSAGTSSTLNGMVRGLFNTTKQSTANISVDALPFIQSNSSSTTTGIAVACSGVNTCFVGIDRSPAPAYNLAVSGQIYTGGYILSGAGGLELASGNHWLTYGNSNGDVSVGTSTDYGAFSVASGTPYFVISSSTGYVGIGTTAPSTTLHVVGSSTFTGNVVFPLLATSSLVGTDANHNLTTYAVAPFTTSTASFDCGTVQGTYRAFTNTYVGVITVTTSTPASQGCTLPFPITWNSAPVCTAVAGSSTDNLIVRRQIITTTTDEISDSNQFATSSQIEVMCTGNPS